MSELRDERPDERLVAETVARLTASLTPVKPLPRDGAMIAWTIGLFTAFAVLAALIVKPIGFQSFDLIQKFVYYGGVLISALLVAMFVVESMIPGSKQRVHPALAIVGSLVLLCLVAIVLFPKFDLQAFESRGMPCLRLGLGCAAMSAILAYGLLAKGYPTSPLRMGVATGLLFGMSGVAVLALHCPRQNAAHIMVWHLGVAVITILLGAGIGYWRARTN